MNVNLFNESKISDREVQLIIDEYGETTADRFFNEINKIENGILVDLGVCDGFSSRLMLEKCLKNNNLIAAIDINTRFTSDNPHWNYINYDSAHVGEHWEDKKVDLVFFDTVHVKEQVLAETYYWWDHIKEGGLAIYHDTSWHGYRHHARHRAAGKQPGSSRQGFDRYGGIDWDTPDRAVETFFNVNLNPPERDINNNNFVDIYEDEYIKVEQNWAFLGLTIVKKKKHFDYKDNQNIDWEHVFERRKFLLSHL